MYYGARYYDPALSFFVSADTIAPDKSDAKTRNRYNYVNNNPLRYTDPTGHCHTDSHHSTEDECNKERRDAFLRTLYNTFNIRISDWEFWTWQELQVLVTALEDLRSKAGWSYEQLLRALGNDKRTLTVSKGCLQESCPGGDRTQLEEGQTGGTTYGGTTPDGNTIILDVNAIRTAAGRADNPDQAYCSLIKLIFVHELAHVWDIKTGKGARTYMQRYYKARNPDEQPASDLSGYSEDKQAQEDFAEAVVGMVFGI